MFAYPTLDLFPLCNSNLAPLFILMTQGHHCIIVKFQLIL